MDGLKYDHLAGYPRAFYTPKVGARGVFRIAHHHHTCRADDGCACVCVLPRFRSCLGCSLWCSRRSCKQQSDPLCSSRAPQWQYLITRPRSEIGCWRHAWGSLCYLSCGLCGSFEPLALQVRSHAVAHVVCVCVTDSSLWLHSEVRAAGRELKKQPYQMTRFRQLGFRFLVFQQWVVRTHTVDIHPSTRVQATTTCVDIPSHTTGHRICGRCEHLPCSAIHLQHGW